MAKIEKSKQQKRLKIFTISIYAGFMSKIMGIKSFRTGKTKKHESF